MKMSKKDLDYYLNLDYKIIVEKIPEKDGGGYEAYIKELGKYTCNGCGETYQEAIGDLLEYKDELIKEWHAKGYSIPEPEEEKEKFSGRFTVRAPRELHKRLYEAAKKNNVSFNHYVVYLLGKNLDFSELLSEVKKAHSSPAFPDYKIKKLNDKMDNMLEFPNLA